MWGILLPFALNLSAFIAGAIADTGHKAAWWFFTVTALSLMLAQQHMNNEARKKK